MESQYIDKNQFTSIWDQLSLKKQPKLWYNLNDCPEFNFEKDEVILKDKFEYKSSFFNSTDFFCLTKRYLYKF